jgi:hypothetical protein
VRSALFRAPPGALPHPRPRPPPLPSARPQYGGGGGGGGGGGDDSGKVHKALHKCKHPDGSEFRENVGFSSSITVGSMLPFKVPLMKGSIVEVMASAGRFEFLVLNPPDAQELFWSGAGHHARTVPKPYKGPARFAMEQHFDPAADVRLALTCWAQGVFDVLEPAPRPLFAAARGGEALAAGAGGGAPAAWGAAGGGGAAAGGGGTQGAPPAGAGPAAHGGSGSGPSTGAGAGAGGSDGASGSGSGSDTGSGASGSHGSGSSSASGGFGGRFGDLSREPQLIARGRPRSRA